MLTAGGWLVLINSVLSSFPMFMMSFFKIPKGVLEKLECFKSRFFWQNDEHRKKVSFSETEYYLSTKILRGVGSIEPGNPKPENPK